MMRSSSVVLSGVTAVLAGVLLAGIYHWYRTGALLGEPNLGPAVAVSWAGAGTEPPLSLPLQPTSAGRPLTHIGSALTGLLVWQDLERAREHLTRARDSWARAADAGQEDARHLHLTASQALDRLPAEGPEWTLAQLFPLLEELPVSAAHLAPNPTPERPGTTSELQRWLSRLLIIERVSLIPRIDPARHHRSLARALLVDAIEASARSDIEQYRARLASLRRLLARDFSPAPANHAAQASLRWIEILPLEALAQLSGEGR